ncbi:redox-sensing transcriptional repressor Rex [Microbacter margulisiae]|uniref:Redox-sensing transcriptional repressor Rex n=1 Tax=Microbacter margulisiae TaxID=1350067 RepID=A0A7W5H117_9PORP|nr:redox-sensing transcriptional repressor Rex [Microbacter margulisiae]MBB3187098.1 redox-sensing transcriptional repressor [Microbacter margulisiae]
MENSVHLPEPAIRRLPWYLSYAKLALEKGETTISSTQIAFAIGVDSSVVAKDLSYIDVAGKTRVGYNTFTLIEVLETFLGFTKSHPAFLFGVGRLGGALLQDNGLRQFGLEIIAAFDVKYELAGTNINHIPIHHFDNMCELRRKTGVDIAVLTVPINRAQEVADFLIEVNFKAIWNFTPIRIKVPDHIVVQNTSIYAHLAVMYNRLEQLKNE